MTNKALMNFLSMGMWGSSYSSHYNSAWQCYYNYQHEIREILKVEEHLRSSLKAEKEHLEPLISHITNDLHDKAYLSATSCHLYACMAIEGFINHYGTKRLGESAYKSLLERTGITEKISLIYLICFETILLTADEPIKSIRKLFDERNALVHPKTKELTPENLKNFSYKHPKDLPTEQTIETLERFKSNICSMDSEIREGSYFRKPTPHKLFSEMVLDALNKS